MQRFLAIVLLCAACSAGSQQTTDAFGELFDDLTLEEARDEAIAGSKLLVLYVDTEATTGQMDRRSELAIENATQDRLLRFWLRQHTVAIKLRLEHKKLAEQILAAACHRCNRVSDGRGCDDRRKHNYTPAFGIFRNNRLFTAVTACRLNCTDDRFNTELGTSMGWAVFELEFQLDRLRALEPGWVGLHDMRNPPITDDGIERFAGREDENAESYDETLVDDPKDVFRAIVLARTQAELGDRYGSAGTYTWIWERAADRDPAFGPAVRTLVNADIKDLVHRWPNFEQRFGEMKNAGTVRMGLETIEEFADWARLCAIVGDDFSMLEEFDYRLNNDLFGSTVPRDTRRVLMLIAENETEVTTRVLNPERAVHEVQRLYDRAEAEPSDEVRPTMRRLALDRAVLYHARLLESGDRARAIEIAGLAIEQDGNHAWLALAAGSLVAGQPTQWHLANLIEHCEPSQRTDRLIGYLEQALAEPGFEVELLP